MLIGSNNSLTYLEPCCLWLKPLKYLGRCQSKGYDFQYLYWGVRVFDFRLYIDNNNHIIVKNGIYKYNVVSFYEILDFFNKRGDTTLIITLDTLNSNESEARIKAIERKFAETCKIIETIYENINFCGGYRRDNKEKLYSFTWEEQHEMPLIITPSEWSRLYRFISKYWPFLIGYLNRRYIRKYDKEKGCLMLNYINKR